MGKRLAQAQSTIRKRKIIAAYKSGLTLRECGERFGVSHQRVHQIICQHCPEQMRGHLSRTLTRRQRARIAAQIEARQ